MIPNKTLKWLKKDVLTAKQLLLLELQSFYKTGDVKVK